MIGKEYRDMQKRSDEFNSEFRRTQRVAIVGMILSTFVFLATLVFLGWVTVKLMAYFSVL